MYGRVDKRHWCLLKVWRAVGNGVEQKVHAIRQFKTYVFRTPQGVCGIWIQVDGKKEEGEISLEIYSC